MMNEKINDVNRLAKPLGLYGQHDLEVIKPSYLEGSIITTKIDENSASVLLFDTEYVDPDIPENGRLLYRKISENTKLRIEVCPADEEKKLFSIVLRINVNPGFFDLWEVQSTFLCRKVEKNDE